MGLYSEEWWFANGDLAANQRAAVFEEDANTLASIFSDAGLTVPLANPTTTDASGVLTFYAADGAYWIFVGKVGTGDSVLARIGGSPDNPVLTVNGEAPDGSGNVTLSAADVGADAAGSAAAAAAASQPLATIDAAGDLYIGTGNNTTTRLPIGSAGEVLTVVAGTASWEPAGGGGGGIPESILDAKGDIIAATAADTAARLAVGTNGQALRANSATATGLEWDTLTASDVGADATGSAAAAQAAAIAASLQKSANLSDVASPSTSRDNLGLGDSAVLDVGTAAGTVAAGDDSRITGAQQRSTLTTKGDLYAATGAATVARQGVGSDGQVLTADAAQATGMKWATPASAPVTSVNTETGAVVLDAADVGADPAGSAAAAQAASQPLDADLTAIAALTPTNDDVLQRKAGAWTNRTIAQLKTDLNYTAAGLGALVAANNLSDVANPGTSRTNLGLGGAAVLNVGTSAGTVAAGDDSRITGAVPKSTVTTKGDLIVATASATVARQGVGSDGQVLTADSSQTNGMKWATPSSSGGVSFATYPRAAYIQAGGAITARSSKAASLNAMYLLPLPILTAATVSAIAFELTSSVVGAVARLGFYSSSASFLPDALVADLGTFTADTTGARTVTGLSQALSAGLNWVAICFQTAAPNARHCAGFNPWVSSSSFPSGTGLGWNIAYVQTGVSGGLPANVGTIADTDAPLVGVKF